MSFVDFTRENYNVWVQFMWQWGGQPPVLLPPTTLGVFVHVFDWFIHSKMGAMQFVPVHTTVAVVQHDLWWIHASGVPPRWQHDAGAVICVGPLATAGKGGQRRKKTMAHKNGVQQEQCPTDRVHERKKGPKNNGAVSKQHTKKDHHQQKRTKTKEFKTIKQR